MIAACRQLVRIDPQPHRVLALAERDDVADAGDALQFVLDEAVHVVAHEQLVVLAVLGVEAGAHHEVARGFRDADADRFHLVGQAAFHRGDAVLHVDRGNVDVVRDVERDRDAAGAVIAGARRHVEHARHAVDGLLERRGDGRLDGLGVGAGVERGDLDLRRRKIRKLRDRQGRDRNRAGQDDDQRAHAREDGTSDEGIDEHGNPLLNELSRRRRGALGNRGAVEEFLRA